MALITTDGINWFFNGKEINWAAIDGAEVDLANDFEMMQVELALDEEEYDRIELG